MRVAVLRCGKLPGFITWDIPGPEVLYADDHRLIAAFAERGVEAESVVWSDPGVDWSRFDVALIRSTWDYIDERERFLAVLAEIEDSSCRLFNPLKAIRWNSDKSYLFDLKDWNIPVVPTLRASTTDPALIQDRIVEQGWQQAIMKPLVGAAGFEVHRVPVGAATLERLGANQPEREFLIQPFVESVVSEGEWSFIFIDRKLSHVLLKKPASGDYRSHGIYGGTIAPAEPRREDGLQAEAMLMNLPFDVLYARLDLVRIDGRLAVMELELVEPMLYFDLAPLGAARLAGALLSRIGRE